MGTPDILGTYGTFSFYTDDEIYEGRDVSGGEIFMVEAVDHRVTAYLHGPENSLKRERPVLRREFTVDIDPEGKKSIRCTKGVDPRLLGEAGRGAIRFAQFVGLMDGDSNSGGTGDVSTNVVFISPTADGAAWDAAAPAVEVASKAVGQEFGQIEAANP